MGLVRDGSSEAEGRAGDRFRSLQQRVTQGLELPRGYGYGSRPVREQILEEMPGPDDRPDAILTRNSYGSVVLNAARAMFVDVDVLEPSGFSLKRMVGLLHGNVRDLNPLARSTCPWPRA